LNKQILRLAIPNIITTITVPLLGIVDLAIVGHMGSEQYIGAIAIATMMFNLIYWNFGFLRMGTSGFTAQAYGAVNKTEIMHVFVRAMSIALLGSFLLIVFQYPIKVLILKLVSGSEMVENYAILYFDICIWAAPATLSLYVIKGWFIGMQNAKTPMWIAIQINVINIALSLFFVLGLGMKIEGVALGTLIAQYLGLFTALVLWYIYYRKYISFIKIKEAIAFDKMKEFFKVNIDIYLRTLCLIAVFTFIPAEGAKMGDTILAVNALLMQFFMLFSYVMDGFAYAGESLAGKYFGARNVAMLKKTIRYLFRWGGGLTALFVLLYVFFGKYLMILFTDNQNVILVAKEYYHWILIVPLAGFSAFLWDGILVGLTATKIMRNAIFIATFIFFIVYFSLSNYFDNNALWLAFMLFLALRGILQGVLAKKYTSEFNA